MMMYTAFLGMTSMTLVPLIQMTSTVILYEASLATGLMMGGLGIAAYMAPSE